MMKDGFYFVRIGLHPYEVIQVADDGKCMYRLGTDSYGQFKDGKWFFNDKVINFTSEQVQIYTPDA